MSRSGSDDIRTQAMAAEPRTSRAKSVEAYATRAANVHRLVPIGVLGGYELIGKLGQGGMAEIFLARHATSQRYVVLKRIVSEFAREEAFVRMFLDESRLVAQLNHPNICHIYEIGSERGAPFIVMEWIDGISLDRLKRKAAKVGNIPISIALRIVSLVAGGLSYAHRARDPSGNPLHVVHRDVSPHNVMVRYDGVVKLLDFGIAKAASNDVRTQTGQIKGKFAYMSPEQFEGQAVDARTDIFALGVCMYELLTGKGLYQRATPAETMRAICRDPVPKLADGGIELPPQLDEILASALAKDLRQRFQTANEMQNAIEKFLAAQGSVVTEAEIAEFVFSLCEDEIREGPKLESPPLPSPDVVTTSAVRPIERTMIQPNSATVQTAVLGPRPGGISPKKLWLASGFASLLLLGAVLAAVFAAVNKDATPAHSSVGHAPSQTGEEAHPAPIVDSERRSKNGWPASGSLTPPWTAMNLPLGGSQILESDATHVAVVYPSADVDIALFDRWAAAIERNGFSPVPRTRDVSQPSWSVVFSNPSTRTTAALTSIVVGENRTMTVGLIIDSTPAE